MHINSNSSPPFCQSSTKGLKTKLIKTYTEKKFFFLLFTKPIKTYPFYIQNKESIKGCSPPFCLNSNMIPIKKMC